MGILVVPAASLWEMAAGASLDKIVDATSLRLRRRPDSEVDMIAGATCEGRGAAMYARAAQM